MQGSFLAGVGASLGGTGCTSLTPDSLAARPGIEPDWLSEIDPIQPARLDRHEFLGDEFSGPHHLVRDRATPPQHGEPTRREDVVIIGGGMSGLGMAYLLRDLQPLVVEQASVLGGNAKGEDWNGLAYSLGAAYLVQLDATDPIERTFYQPLGLSRHWRTPGESTVEFERGLYSDFWSGTTRKAREGSGSSAQFTRLEAYFRRVLDEAYPDIPPTEPGVIPESLAALDRRTFLDVVTEAAGGPLDPHIRTLIEHYSWSSFGGGMAELSAAAGLNFFASEFGGIHALPGGNSQVASRMLRQLARDGMTRERFLTRTTVTAVTPTASGDEVLVTWRNAAGQDETIRARSVVMACPKFVAKRILTPAVLPTAQRAAMDRLTYRGYVVANVLVDEPMPDLGYDLFLLGDGRGISDLPLKEQATDQRATDVIMGHWASRSNEPRSVLTFYRALPYDGGRGELLAPDAYERMLGDTLAQMAELKDLFALSRMPPREAVRLARWGHPMVLAAPGLIADGTLTTAAKPIADRIFFANQDNWALPAIETCLAVALEMAPKVAKKLGARGSRELALAG